MKTINDRIENIINEFSKIQSWEDRYTMLIVNGKKMKGLEQEDKCESNIIKGCQSQVWLTASLEGTRIVYKGDSDASIVRGIVALLMEVYSGSTPAEILGTKPDFIETIGLKQHLSMSRANGLNAMIKQITIYAMAYQAKLNM